MARVFIVSMNKSENDKAVIHLTFVDAFVVHTMRVVSSKQEYSRAMGAPPVSFRQLLLLKIIMVS